MSCYMDIGHASISQTLHSLPIRNRIASKFWLFLFRFSFNYSQPILVFISGNLLQFESRWDNTLREHYELKQRKMLKLLLFKISMTQKV